MFKKIFILMMLLTLLVGTVGATNTYTEQEVLNLVLDGNTLGIHGYTSQDVLNLVFDTTNSALRVTVDGGDIAADTITISDEGWIGLAVTKGRLIFNDEATDLLEFKDCDVSVDALTASRLLATDASKVLESADIDDWLDGTADYLSVTDDGDGTATLATINNKDIVTTAPLTGGTDNVLPGADVDITIAMPAAATAQDGYLTSTNWNTFNGKLDNVVEDATPQLGGDLDGQGNYLLDSQSITNLASKGASYWFDETEIEIPDDSNLQLTNGTIICSFILHDVTSNQVIWSKDGLGNVNDAYLRITGSDSIIRLFTDDTSTQTSIESNSALVINTQYTIAVTFGSDGMKMYVNGILQDDTSAITNPIISNGNVFAIGNRQDIEDVNMTFNQLLIFNTALTADEVADLYSGKELDYKYIGASQTELMPNQVDRDFSGASAWANVDINAYDETDDLTITASAIGQYCTLPVLSAPTTIGKRYRMTYDCANIVSTWTIKSFDGTQTIGTVSADGTQDAIEWTATTTGGYRIVSVANDSSADFDNFTLTAIGNVANYSSDGIGHNTWSDVSGNNLYGTVSGAKAINMEYQQDIVRQNNISANVQILSSSNVVPAGYRLVSMIALENNSGEPTLDLGTTDGASNVFSQQVFTQNTLTTVDIGITFSLTDDTALWLTDDGAGTWNSGVLSTVIFILERVQ